MINLEVVTDKPHWPVRLDTDAGMVYLTKEELETLEFQIFVARMTLDQSDEAASDPSEFKAAQSKE